MGHLDTAYRLGQEKAAADLGELLASGIDNPTMAPPRLSNTKTAVERMVEKLSARRCTKKTTSPMRAPTSKRTNYAAMVRKLKKRRKAAKGR